MAGTDERARIVVGIDPSGTSDEAVRWAADAAATRGVPLVLLHAVPAFSQHLVGTRGGADEVGAAAQELLSGKVSELARSHAGLEVLTEITTAAPYESILEQSERSALLVLGSHERGPLGRAFLGSVSHFAAMNAVAPVAVVRRAVEDRDAPIVVGTDGSKLSRPALAFAFQEAAYRKVPLQVVRAWKADVPVDYGRFVLDPQVRSVVRQDVERSFAADVEPHASQHPDVEVRTTLVDGDPTTVLADAAASAQLLVVGTRGRGAVGRALLGSVATNLLHGVSTPIVVVPVQSGT